MPLGALLSGLGMVLAVLAPQYALTVVLLLLSGVGVAAFHPEGYRYAGLAAGDRRNTGMSYFSVGGNIGYGFGPAAATVALSLAGVRGMSYLLIVGTIAAIFMWHAVTPDLRAQLEANWATSDYVVGQRAVRAEGEQAPIGTLIMLVVFVVLRSWMMLGMASFIPLYYTGVKGGVLASVFLGAGGLGTLIGAVAADRWGRRSLIILSMVILPPLLWSIPRLAGIWVLLAASAAGMAGVSTFAIVMVIAQELMPARMGMISGLLIGFAVGMGGVGVTALGVIADRWGLLTAMDVTALLPLVGLVIGLVLPADRVPATRPALT